jgi:hypothetical protein
VDANMDGQPLTTGLVPEAEDKFALMHGLDEPGAFLAGAGDVVGCFGEEESLPSWLSMGRVEDGRPG